MDSAGFHVSHASLSDEAMPGEGEIACECFQLAPLPWFLAVRQGIELIPSPAVVLDTDDAPVFTSRLGITFRAAM